MTATPDECWAKAGDRYVLADALADAVLKQARARARPVPPRRRRAGGGARRHCRRASLRRGSIAFWAYEVPVLAGDFVTDDAGTGFVHTAPSHGADDYELFVKNGLVDRMTHNVLEDSSFAEHVPFFKGLQVFDAKGKEGKANRAVIDKLIEAGALLARGRMTHSYPHSWRSKAPVIYRNTPQWFVAIDKPLDDGMDTYGATIRERALTSIDRLVQWTPVSGRNRLYSMIEARPDWVLSRQRAWGVPLTCFVKRRPDGTVEILRDPAVNARIRDAFEHEGADAWFEEGAKARFLAGDHPHDDWEKVTDILDVWFDSGSHPRLRAARPARRHLAGERLSRGHRPAPRLVPLLDAPVLRHAGPGALRRGGDPRLHPRRERHEDVEVARQHHRARRT